MSVEIWNQDKPRGKDIVAMIGTILTVVFKILILAAVIIVFSWTGMSWIVLTLVILAGVVWALGVSNMVYLYLLFKGKIEK